MYKYLIIAFMLFNFIFGIPAFAHAPSDILLDFDAANKIITVAVTHSIENQKGHFIKEIKVKLNDNTITIQRFLSQTNQNAQVVSYVVIDAKSKDTVEVAVTCSTGEALNKVFRIE